MRLLSATILLGTVAMGLANDSRVPAFIWGSSDFIQPAAGGETRRVSYQTETTTLLDELVGSTLQSSPLPQSAQRLFRPDAVAPQVTVLFLGRQVDLSAAARTQPLQSALTAAAASVSLPYMQHQGGSLKERLLGLATTGGAAATVHHVGACGGEAAPLRGAQLPTLDAGRRAVVVVCPSDADSQEDEMAALEGLTAAVAALNTRHLFVYASDAEGAPRGGMARSLLAKAKDSLSAASPPPAPSPPGELVCDARCRTQVSQLEAGILLITLLVALGLGTYCMGILDTPTRFEQVKDDR